MKKVYKKVIAVVLAASLGLSLAFPTFAAEKEEVIYVMANADGSVTGVYAVNSFDGGEITDYGDYSDIKLLNIDGKITQNGDEITFSSPENDKVYYQGTLQNAQIPWDISIRFFLDGKELSADETAGKSGSLEIKVKISENENCKMDFYDNYALQCSFTLDTGICKNITADGATIANVGSKKQITFTALAGSGIDRSIKADVTDFEMPSAQINGIRMDLGIDIDFDGDVTELTDGATKLDDGAKELNDGVSELKDGTTELVDGIKKLRDGIDKANEGLTELCGKSSQLTDGSSEISNALITIQSALSKVSADTGKLEELTAASSQIKSGIDNLYAGITELKKSISYDSFKGTMAANGLDIDALKAGNAQAAQQLTAQIKELKATLNQIKDIPQYAQQVAELTAQITQLETIVQLLTGNNAMISGTELYFNTVGGGAEQLEAGAKELKTKYAQFDAAINELARSMEAMLVDMSSLKAGIDTLVTEYAKLDSGITEYTNGVSKLCEGFTEIKNGAKDLAEGSAELSDGVDELLRGTKELKDGTGKLKEKADEIDGDSTEKLNEMLESINNEYETVSFISDKNKDVSSVQFVIKTEAIEIPEPEAPVEEPAEQLNFWQKLLRLFGLY
ncbi:MAG: hypothetical protein ACI4JI_09245 [Ruminiclostridium sp.]